MVGDNKNHSAKNLNSIVTFFDNSITLCFETLFPLIKEHEIYISAFAIRAHILVVFVYSTYICLCLFKCGVYLLDCTIIISYLMYISVYKTKHELI